MDKNHPLQYFLKKRKIRESDVDEFISLITSSSWMRGKVDGDLDVDANREAWAKIKKFLIFKVK